MSLNDEVCTSDPDELESLFATKPNYWRTKPPLPSSSQITDNTSIRLTQKPIPSSQPLDDSPRPRKRLKLHEMPSTSTLPRRDNLFASLLPSPSPMSSPRDDSLVSDIPRMSSTHLDRLKGPEPFDDVEMDDEHLLSMRPYRPLDVPSTPASNSPSSPSPHYPSQDPLGLSEYPPLCTPPDATSSPSEPSRSIGDSSSFISIKSPPPATSIRRSSTPQSEFVDSEPRPGPEDAEGSTRRWSFRSRKANQLQPYRFDRLQYKRQLRGNPDAVVVALSPRRRRASPGSTMDRDFIADEEDTQETGEQSGLTVTGEGESQPQSGENHHPRREVSPRVSPPVQPPPQWYLDGMNEISDADGDDDDVIGYLVDRSRKKQPATEHKNNGEVPADTEKSDDQPKRRRKRHPKPPPWFRHIERQGSLSPDPPLPNGRESCGRSTESVAPPPDFAPQSPGSLSDDRSESVPPQPSLRRNRRPSTPVESSDDSETDEEAGLSKKQLRALRRMLPAGMIQKQLHQPPPTRRSRSVTVPPQPEPERTSSPSQVIPGRARKRRVDPGAGLIRVIEGDPESSDGRRSVISVSSTGHSISDIEELRSRTFPGVLDLFLDSSDESNISDVEDANVDDADIGAWIHHKPVNLRPDYGDFGEAEEGDLIDRMLSRTTVSRRRTKKPAKNATLNLPVVKRSHRKRKKPTNIYVGGSRPHGHSRQLRIPDLFGTGGAKKRVRDAPDQRPVPREGKRTHDTTGRAGNTGKNHSTGKSTLQRKKKQSTVQIDQNHNFPTTTTRIITGRQHVSAMNLELEEEPGHTPHQRSYSPGNSQQDTPAYSVLEATNYRAIHPSEFRVLPRTISFGPNTYLGRGWLRDLLAELSGQDVTPPPPFLVQEVELDSMMDVEDFAKVFVSTVDRLLATLQIGTAKLMVDWNEWQNTLHPLFRLFTWMASGGYLITKSLRDDALERASRFAARLDAELERTSTTETKAFLLTARWVSFELLLRVHGASGSIPLYTLSTTLVEHLFQPAFLKPAALAFPDPAVIDKPNSSQQLFQVWICLIHTLEHLAKWFHQPTGDVTMPPDTHPIWKLVLSTWVSEKLSDLDASEKLWNSIFNLCAVSQFSPFGISSEVPRLSARWDVVLLALRRIRLVTGQADDSQIPRRRAIKRDQYIRLLFSRCFFLRKQWSWNLKDASALFGLLSDVFKNRKFSNLNGEASDFPSFVRHDMSLLSEYRNSDTAFGLFLKLAVLAVKDMREVGGDPGLPLKLRKLMSVLIPVGSVPFTKDTPPTSQELSMLYNRLSSIVIAIYLDPNTTNANSRIAQARRYVTFKDADLSTRRACIRGMMHFAMITCRLQLPLTLTLEWITEATDVLLDEYKAFPPNDTRPELKNRIVLTLQLLIGSLRRILDCIGEKDPKVYPDPTFMEGPWVARVFSTVTDIVNLPTTGIEIQRLVQTFLNVRAAYMPKPRRPTIHAATEDSQESQDYFGIFDIDLDDPDLQAALGDEPESPEAKEVARKDKSLAEVVHKTVVNGIFKLVMKRVTDVPEESSRELAHFDLDKWIDCWVGCAQIVVHNGLRAWSFYLALGDKSWERIGDGPWRRRIGLRFMFMLLVLDPASYTSHKDNFFDVLFESLVTSELTMEYQYVSLLFSVDGLQHPLVDGLALQRGPDGDYLVTKPEFEPLRLTVVIRATQNLSARIQQEGERPELRGNNQAYIGHLLRMLSVMEDILQSLILSKSSKAEGYKTFQGEIMNALRAHPELVGDERLGRAIARVSRVGGS